MAVAIPQVALLTEDPGLVEAATAAIWEAGAAVQPLVGPSQLGQLAIRPRVVVCGHDLERAAVAALGRSWPECQVVWAALGEHASGFGPGLILPQASRRLTMLVEAACRPPLSAQRVALIGAHGGAGASCLAVALALDLATRPGGRTPLRLIGLNRSGASLGALLGLDQASLWDEAALARAGLALRTRPGSGGAQALGAATPLTAAAVIQGIEVREAEPGLAAPAWRVRQELEAWEAEAPGGHTVLDAALAAPGGAWRAASWADRRVIVGRADPAGAAALAALAADFDELGLSFSVAVRAIRGGLDAAEVADGIVNPSAADAGRVFAIGDERSFTAGLVHGLVPGERAKGKLARAARDLAKWVGPDAVEARRGPVERRKRRPEASRPDLRRAETGRTEARRALPTFDPTAFAEEW
ncbi:MAG: hypothetical protein LBS27_03440 [Bifidobacteriaceae bacterium]|jgi:hypothetical protein|nr:hypothetical protein [Bifidobacteriaceae bacterium]